MTAQLNGKRTAFLVAPEGVEQAELTEPWKAVEQAGGTPELISTEVGKPWTLVEADVIRGRTLTSWPSPQTDIRNARGNRVDEEVVVDQRRGNTMVSSRKPDDLPAFCGKLVDAFAA